jgi:pSer/pThr/pTyr-binding forkhead associated (FHA) protein
MTDQVLDILKLVLLVLLYLFFARVLWAVWSEVRDPANARADVAAQPAMQSTDNTMYAPIDGTQTKPAKGRGGSPARLVVLEPKGRRGATFAISGTVGIGREDDNVVQILDDTYVSSHHAVVSLADGHVVLDDLDSRNGTYLNGTRIAVQRSVQIGDRIQVGYTVLEAQ